MNEPIDQDHDIRFWIWPTTWNPKALLHLTDGNVYLARHFTHIIDFNFPNIPTKQLLMIPILEMETWRLNGLESFFQSITAGNVERRGIIPMKPRCPAFATEDQAPQ